MALVQSSASRRRLQLKRWIVAAASMAALAAMDAVAQAAAAPAPLRILAVGEPDWPAIQALGKHLQGPAMQAAGLPAVGMDLIRFESHQQMLRDIRAMHPQLQRYAALYVASISAARMIQREVGTVPIIFEGVDDALQRCLVNSLQSPGRNATGYMHLLEDNEPRMLQLLHDAFPALKQVVVLASGTNLRMLTCDEGPQPTVLPGCVSGLHDSDATVQRIMAPQRLLEQGRLQGLRVRFLVLCSTADLSRLEPFVGPDAGVLVPWQDLFDRNDKALADALAKLRRPAIAARRAFAEAGGLMALSVQMPTVKPRESLRLLTQVLQGQSTTTLPVSTPYGLRLTVNARAAHVQGLRPAMEVWQRADEVLE